jgi:hypothetical protein
MTEENLHGGQGSGDHAVGRPARTLQQAHPEEYWTGAGCVGMVPVLT